MQQNEVEVWLDERAILVGESIPAKIQEGLQQADFLALLLSSASLQSGWVETEWQTQIWREAQERRVTVLPLLADACPVPPLLQHKKYADFSQDYQRGLADLLTAIQQ